MKRIENQTKGLAEHTKKRTEAALEKVKHSLEALSASGEKITKYSVFKHSGTSRKFVYYNDEVNALLKEYLSTDESETASDPIKVDPVSQLKLEKEELLNEVKEMKKLKKEHELLLMNYEKLNSQYEVLEKQFSQVCQQKGLI